MSTFVLAIIFVSFLCLAAEQIVVRPLYIVSHLTNSKAFIEEMLDKGANAIELDTRFDSNYNASRFYHGGSCNCGREVNGSCGCESTFYCSQEGKIAPILQYLRDIANPANESYRPSFSGFVWLDIKHPGLSQSMTEGGRIFGSMLLDDVFDHKNNGSRLQLGLEQYNIYGAPFVRGVSERIKDRGREDVIERFVTIANRIEHTNDYLKLNEDVTPAIWMAEGSDDCSSFDFSRVESAIRSRDVTTGMAKVAMWTLDSKTRMREAMREGVDAILTNYPERVIEVLQEPEFNASYRLATSLDRASQKIVGLAPPPTLLSLTLCQKEHCLDREANPDNGSSELTAIYSKLLLMMYYAMVVLIGRL